nr:cardiomyopathy-associated protein 5 isoform X2 [Geotrypetes seraphini]
MEGPGPADSDRASEISFSIDEEVPEGVLEPHEAEELTSSLKYITQSEDVKPKLQCIMSNPSFSMVTVQCEDSGITWETSSSRCSTPWASEASTTSDVYSIESSSVGSHPGRVVFIMDENKIRRKKILKSPGRALLSSRVKGDLSRKRHESFESRVQESNRMAGTKCNLGVAEEPTSRSLITAKFMNKEDMPQTGIPTYKESIKAKIKKYDSESEYPEVPLYLSQNRVYNAPILSTKVKREENTVLKESLNQIPSSSDLPQPEHFDIKKDNTTIHNVQPVLIIAESKEMPGNHISPLDRTERKQNVSYLHEESHLIMGHACSVDEAAKQESPSLSTKAVDLVSEDKEPILYVTDEAEKQMSLPMTAKLLSEQSKPLLSHATDGVEKEEFKVYSPETANIVSKEASLTEKSNEIEIYQTFSKSADSVMDEAPFTSYFDDEPETKNILTSIPEIVNFITQQKKSVPFDEMNKTEKEDAGVPLPVTSEFKPEEAQFLSLHLADETKKEEINLYSPIPSKQKSKQSKSISPIVIDQAEKKTSPLSSHEQETYDLGSLNKTPYSDFTQPEHFDIEKDNTTIHNVQPDLINGESNEMPGNHISPLDRADRQQNMSHLNEESHLITEHAKSISSYPVDEAANQENPSLPSKGTDLVSEDKEPISYVTDEAEKQMYFPITGKLLSQQSKPLLSHATDEVEKEDIKDYSSEIANIVSKKASITEKSKEDEIHLPFSKTLDSVMVEAAFTSYFDDEPETKNILSLPELVNFIIEQKKSAPSDEMDKTETQDAGLSLPVTSEFKPEEAQCLSFNLTDETNKQIMHPYSPVPSKRKSKQSKPISAFVVDQAEKKTSPTSAHEQNANLKGTLNQTPFSSDFQHPEHIDTEKDDTTIHDVQPDLIHSESNEMFGDQITPLDRTDRKQNISSLHEESYLITEHAKFFPSCPVDEAARHGSPPLPTKEVNLVSEEKEPIPYDTEEAEKQVYLPMTAKLLSEQSKPLLSHPTNEVEKEEIKVYSPEIANIVSKEAPLTEKSKEYEIYQTFPKALDSVMDETVFTSYFEDEPETKNILSSLPELVNFIIEQKKPVPSNEMDKTETQDSGVNLPVTSELKPEEAQCLLLHLTDETKKQDIHPYSPVPAKRKSRQSKPISPFVMDQAEKKTIPSSSHEQKTYDIGFLNQTPYSDFPQPEHFYNEKDDTTIHNVQTDLINGESNEMSGNQITPLDRKQNLSYSLEESILITEHAKSISSCPVDEAAMLGNLPLPLKGVNLVSEEEEPIPYVTDEAEKQVCLPMTAKLLSEQSKPLLSHPTNEVEIKVYSPEIANIVSKEAPLTEKSKEHEIYQTFSKTLDLVMDEAAFTSYFDDEPETKNILSLPELVNFIIEQKKSAPSDEMDKTETQDAGLSLPVAAEFKPEEAQCLSFNLTDETNKQIMHSYSPVPSKRKSKQSKPISAFVIDQAEKKTSPTSAHEQNANLKGTINQTPFSTDFPQPEHFDTEKDDTIIHDIQPALINSESNEMSGDQITPLDRTDRKQNISSLHEESYLIKEHAKFILSCPVDEAAKHGSSPLLTKEVNLDYEEKEPIPYDTEEAEKQVCLPMTAKLLSEQSKPLLSHPTNEVEKEEIKVYSPEIANIVSKEAPLTEKSKEHEIYQTFSQALDSVMDETVFTSYFDDEPETKNILSSLPELVNFIIEQKKPVPSDEMDKTETQDSGVSLPVTSELKPEEAQCLSLHLADETKKQDTHPYSPVPAKRKSRQLKPISPFVMDQAEKKTIPSSSHEQKTYDIGFLNQTPYSDFPQPEHFDNEKDDTTIHNVQPDLINGESNEMSGNQITPLDRKQNLSYSHEESILITEHAKSISSCPVDEAAMLGNLPLPLKGVNLVSEEEEPISYVTDEAEKQVCLPMTATLLSEQSKALLSHPTDEVEKEEIKVYSPEIANIVSKEASLTEKSKEHELHLPFSKTLDLVMDEAAFTSYFDDEPETKNILSLPELVNFIIEQKKSVPFDEIDKTETQEAIVSLPVTSEFKSEEAQCLSLHLADETNKQSIHPYSPFPAKRKSKQAKSVFPYVMDQAVNQTSLSSTQEQNTNNKGSLNQTSSSLDFSQPEYFRIENDETAIHNIQPDLINAKSNEMSRNQIAPLDRIDRKPNLSYLHEESAKCISSYPINKSAKKESPSLPLKAVKLVSEEKESIPYDTDEAEKQVCLPEQSKAFSSHPTDEVEKDNVNVYSPEMSNEPEIYIPFSKIADSVMDEAPFTSFFDDEPETKNILTSIPEIVNFITEQKKSTPSYDMDKTGIEDTGLSLAVTSEFKLEEGQCLSTYVTEETKKQGTHLCSPIPAKRKSKQAKSISSFAVNREEKKTSPSPSHKQNADFKESLNQIPSSSEFPETEHFDIGKDYTIIHNVQPDIVNAESNEMTGNQITPLDRADRKQNISYLNEESYLITEDVKSISSYPVDEATNQENPLLSKGGDLVSEDKVPISYVTDEAEKQVCLPMTAKLLLEHSKPLLSHPTEDGEKVEVKVYPPEITNIASKETSLTEKSNEPKIYLPFSKTVDSVMDEVAFTSYFEDEAETKNVLTSIPEIVNFIIQQKASTPSYEMDKTEKQDTGVSLPVTKECKPEDTQCLKSYITEEMKKQDTHSYSPVPAKRKSKQSKSVFPYVVDQTEKKRSPSFSNEMINLISEKSCDLSVDHDNELEKQGALHHSTSMVDALRNESETHLCNTFQEAESHRSHSVPDLPLKPDLISTQFSSNRQNKLSNDASEMQIISVNEIAKPAELVHPPNRPVITQLKEPGDILKDANDPESQTNVFSIVSEGYEILNILVPPQISSVDQEESKHMQDKLEYLEENPIFKTKPLLGVGDKVSNQQSDANILDNKKDNSKPKELLIKNDTGNKELEEEVFPFLKSQKSISDMDYFEKYSLIDDNVPAEVNIKTFADKQALVDVNENPEKVKECVSLTESPDVCMLESEYYDFDEAFYGTAKENDLPSHINSCKVLKAQKTFDNETKADKNGDLKSESKTLFTTEEGVLTRSPFFPVNVKYIDPELLEEPPALPFLYKDLYEDAKGDTSKKSNGQSDEDSIDSETSLPCRNSDTDDGTGIYFEKYILRDEIPFDVREAQKVNKGLTEVVSEQLNASEVLSEELLENIPKGITDVCEEKEQQSVFVQKDGNVRDAQVEEKNDLFVRSKICSPHQVEMTCETYVSHKDELTNFGLCGTFGEHDLVTSDDTKKDHQFADKSLKDGLPQSPVLQQILEQKDNINKFSQPEEKEPLEAGCLNQELQEGPKHVQQKMENAKKQDNKRTAGFQNVQLKEGVYKSSQSPDLFEKGEHEEKMNNMYGLDITTKLTAEDGSLQSVEENISPLPKFEIQPDNVIDNLDLQNFACKLEDIHRLSETERKQGIAYKEEADELMDYDVITHDELLQDELLSDYAHDGFIFSEDRESSDQASESTYDFVSDAELNVPAEHEQEDSRFEIIDSEMLTTELSEKYSEKELKKSQIDTYCYTCRCPISAIDKIFGAHKDHEVTSLNKVAAEMMGRLEEFLERLQESSIKAEERVGEIESLFNHVEENCSQIEKLLEEQNEEMIKKVIAQHTEKSQNFEEVKKMKMEYLYEQMVSFQQSIETAKEILEKSDKEVEESNAVTLLS